MTDPSVTITTGVRSYRRAALAFGLLILLPIALSLINITFAQSWKVHFFPAAIFLAAVSFGPVGGFVAGITGSLYSALMLGNPYLIVGNVILGVMTGVLVRKSFNIIPAVLLAYACQLPWLIVSDYFFAGLSAEFIARLVVVLFLGNLLWALLIALTMKPIKKYLC
jgi:hypothetical protein